MPIPSLAANTGTISGTVVDAQSGAPIANVSVSAASGSGSRTSTTDARGFYTLQALIPDTYTVSFQAQGYTAASVPGVTVQQGMVASVNQSLSKALKTIATVRASGSSNLVKPNETSDVYTVSGAQLNALSGGNNLHKTLYQYVQGVAGVTSLGFPGQPRIHGGSVTDIAYEFDGIPIKERITGFFTTNLSNAGIANVEVYTGGLSAADASSGLGIINTVVKTGTYPSFGILSYGTAVDGSRLNDLTAEYGGATPNRRFSWYAALDKTNSLNQYASGLTYPAVEIEGDNGPGPVKTTDIIGNFHYRPNNKDDFQLLYQNGVGEFIYSYLMQRAPGEPVPLTAVACPGHIADPTTYTGGSGGLAPNGQPCPLGFYFGTANTQQGGGNIWHHYSGIGKVQWNHILNDHSFFALRLAENYNEYSFDQPIVESNLLPYEDGDFTVNKACPALPYAAGTPIVPGSNGHPCMQQTNWFSTGYFQDRRSEMWLGALDYTNQINANTTIQAGIGDEYDANQYDVFYTWFFNSDGTAPAINFLSDYPTHVPYAYAQGDLRFGKWLLAPGLRYQQMSYDYPGGPLKVGLLNPTFSATYTMGTRDVLRGSYTTSNTFVGSGYVYRTVPNNALNGAGGTPYNPSQTANFSANPTIIHSGDLQWEYQIDPNTTIKFGPWFNKSTNVFWNYRPVISAPGVVPVQYGPTTPSNGGLRQAFGMEFALNHVDNREKGVSWWLTGTYDNFWTNITSGLTSSFGVSPLKPGIPPIRSLYDPLFSGTLTMDIHNGYFSLFPMVYYQTPAFYNLGITSTKLNGVTVPPYISQNEKMGNGYWIANVTGEVKLGSRKDTILGVAITNLFDNTNDVAPCTPNQLGNSKGILYPGCGPFWPSTPQNGVTAGSSMYQNYSQSPTQIQLFFTKKLP